MEHPYGEDDFARTAMKRKHNTYNHFNGGTFYEAVADSALRLKRENIQLKEEKKELENIRSSLGEYHTRVGKYCAEA